MQILIVEDDAALGIFLQKGLALQGHTVHLVRDGASGLEHALGQPPDLMVLDLSLPRKDGIQVLEGMQGRFHETSVLVLTGRNGVEDRVRCLDLGADDCMLKPFSFSELTARCKALIRRREQFADPILRFAGVELNRMERTVARDSHVVDLTAKEFLLLEYLMQARGRCCTRAELLREVWQMSPDAGTNVVDVYVNYLRKKLGAARRQEASDVAQAGTDRIIDTVRGEGYALTAAGAATQATARLQPAALHGLPRGFGAGVFGAAERASA